MSFASTPATMIFFTAICALTGIIRLIEMTVSRRHQRMLAARGRRPIAEAIFPWMVLLHTGVIVAGPWEVWWFHRPWVPLLALPASLAWAAAQALRWWVIATLGQQWNVKVIASTPLKGVVTNGPYRYIRHPNYVAVAVELLALPLIHTAWLTAVLGLIAHAIVLTERIDAEERSLNADERYRALMAGKPRFIPRWNGMANRMANGNAGDSNLKLGS